MSEGTYYASSHPDVLAAWEAANESHYAFAAAMKAAADQLGGVNFTHYPGSFTVVGITDEGQEPPEGWQRRKTKDYFTPRRGKAGDEARELLKQLSSHTAPRKVLAKRVGIPDLMMWGPKFLHPGVHNYSDRVWVVFGEDVTTDPFREGKNPLDEWWPRREEFGFEQVKASEYHLAREAAEVTA